MPAVAISKGRATAKSVSKGTNPTQAGVDETKLR